MAIASVLPHALSYLSAAAHGRRLVFFLDYDGTLCPIIADPDRAILSKETRDALCALSGKHTTAIVSGRSLDKVRGLVAIDDLIYAGSHGFDIQGPPGTVAKHTVGSEVRPALEAVSSYLAEMILPKYPGSTLEDNKYALSVHFRNCPPEASIANLEADVDDAAARHGLRKTHGKMVYELRPRINWNKGKAVEYLLEALHLKDSNVLPVYVGDDVTDEDAFKTLSGRGGISVIVASAEEADTRLTAANCRLEDTHEVRHFISHFAAVTSSQPHCGSLADGTLSRRTVSSHMGSRQHTTYPSASLVPTHVPLMNGPTETSSGIAAGVGGTAASSLEEF